MIDWEKEIREMDEARADLEARRELIYRVQRMQAEMAAMEKKIAAYKEKENDLTTIASDNTVSDEERKRSRLEAEHIKVDRSALEARVAELKANIAEFETAFTAVRSFNKYICFSNIRELLKRHPEVKLGQIEKDAGCQAGYMSRLEKPNNNSEPTIEFVMAAAKAFGISIDSLLTVDLVQLTPTESYLVSLIQKLVSDTTADKLYWYKESADQLDRLETDINGIVDHPLFSFESFFEEIGGEYPQKVSRIVFPSNAFDVHTSIHGDCYHLGLKNGATLFLMDIEKSVHAMNDADALAKEMWIYTPNVGTSFLVDNRGTSPLARLVDILFSTVAEQMKHPRIKKEHLAALDAFMQDDFKDDPPASPFDAFDDGELPF